MPQETAGDGVPIYFFGLLQAWQREMADARGRMGAVQNSTSSGRQRNATFAKETGGMAFFPRFQRRYRQIFNDILQQMRNQYSLGYQPTNRRGRQIPQNQNRPGQSRHQRAPKGDERKGQAHQVQIVAKAGYTAPRAVE